MPNLDDCVSCGELFNENYGAVRSQLCALCMSMDVQKSRAGLCCLVEDKLVARSIMIGVFAARSSQERVRTEAN